MIRLRSIAMAALALCLAGAAVAHEDEAPKFKSSIDLTGVKEGAYSKLAKISFQQAVTTALAKIEGPISEFKAELEDENGLIYSIEAKMVDGSAVEVNIDAGTGKVLEVAKESKEECEKERKHCDMKDGDDKDSKD